MRDSMTIPIFSNENCLIWSDIPFLIGTYILTAQNLLKHFYDAAHILV